jgi:hypothetical protein
VSSPSSSRSSDRPPLDVYVIPVATDRYELYVERRVHVDEGVPASGLVGRIRDRFWSLLRAAEEREERPRDETVETGWVARLKAWFLEWIAQRVAEQRLLWNLRGCSEAVAVHPQDMAFDQVLTLVRRVLQRDYERHRRWFVIDGLGFLVTSVFLGPLFLLIPGVANLPAAYFGFRLLGHCLSLVGARQGLRRVNWTGRPAAPLDALRDLVTAPAHERDARVREVADRLQLERLPHFFERMTARHA